jgi:hypothetical protein
MSESLLHETKLSQINGLFPLYVSLYEKTKKSEINMNWNTTSSKINSMNEKEMEILYVLILSHYFVENKTFLEKKKMTPYKGKLMDGNKGILYTITDIPLKLQQIIYLYVETIRS